MGLKHILLLLLTWEGTAINLYLPQPFESTSTSYKTSASYTMAFFLIKKKNPKHFIFSYAQHKQHTEITLYIRRWTTTHLPTFCCWVWRHTLLTDLAQKPKSNCTSLLELWICGCQLLRIMRFPQPLGNNSFIIASRANLAMRCHQVLSGELPVLLQSELLLSWERFERYLYILTSFVK